MQAECRCYSSDTHSIRTASCNLTKNCGYKLALQGHFGSCGYICRLLACGQDPLQAVAGPRVHHQLLPDTVDAEHWNVSSTGGPSFMVPDAEVQVRLCLTYLRSCLSVCTCVCVALVLST